MDRFIRKTMFARVTVVQVKTDSLDETKKLYEESVIPAAKSQKGYRGAYMMSDPKTGKGLSFTLWDSEADANANEQSGYYQQQVAKFKDFLTSPPIREGYEVTVQD